MSSPTVSQHDISLFLPEPDSVVAGLPTSIDDYWAWQGQTALITPYWGRYHWVLQTYLYLKQAGMPVVLTNTIPRAGIIITHMDCIDYGFKPTPEQFLAIMLVDRKIPHPRAHIQILHNPIQRLPLGLMHRYIPPWPQIGLIPRDPARRDRFETLGYFGYPSNLHPSISDPAFQREIGRIGLRLYVPASAEWHDFSGVDCVMAIRNFGRIERHLNKPSLKLFNAWLAEVPAILGFESAYREEGRPGSAYLEATTPDELLESLRLLQSDPDQRRALVAQGRAAVHGFSVARTTERWRALLNEEWWSGQQPAAGQSLRALGRGALGLLRERVLWRRPGWFQ